MIVFGSGTRMFNRSLSGFGQWGDVAAKMQLWPASGFGFNESWARDNWLGIGNWLPNLLFWNLGSYSPPSQSTLDRAAKKQLDFQQAIDLGNDKAAEIYAQLSADIARYTTAADKSIKSEFDGWGNSTNAGNAAHADILTKLNQAITKLANATVPATIIATGPSGSVVDNRNAGTAYPDPMASQNYMPTTQIVGSRQGQALTSGSNVGTRATLEEGMPAWVLPAAIGGGILVVGGAMFLLTKKKAPAPAMAGYRGGKRRARTIRHGKARFTVKGLK